MLVYQQMMDKLHSHGYRDFFFVQKETDYLASNLSSEELPLAAIRGFDGRFNTILCVLTKRRLLFIDSGWLYGTKVQEVPLRKVNAINDRGGLLFAKLSITNGADEILVKTVLVRQAQRFVSDVNEQLAKWGEDDQQGQQVGLSTADELLKYKDLLDQGAITQKEYSAFKKQLLSQD